MPFIESAQEFSERMGCPYRQIGRRRLFQNSGQWILPSWGDGPGFGVDPAGEGSETWLRLRLEYEIDVRDELETQAQRLRQTLNDQTTYASRYTNWEPPTDEQIAELRKMRDELHQQRIVVAKLKAALDKMHVASPVSQQQERLAQNRQRAAEVAAQLREISI